MAHLPTLDLVLACREEVDQVDGLQGVDTIVFHITNLRALHSKICDFSGGPSSNNQLALSTS